MYAVVETGGKQLRVREGDVVRLELLDVAPGDEVVLDRVLCLAGDGILIPGHPTVPGAAVVGKVLAQARGRKIVVFKYKAKVNYRRKTGHRQSLTVVQVTGIRTPGGSAPDGDVAGDGNAVVESVGGGVAPEPADGTSVAGDLPTASA